MTDDLVTTPEDGDDELDDAPASAADATGEGAEPAETSTGEPIGDDEAEGDPGS